jgi:hypothetical protein
MNLQGLIALLRGGPQTLAQIESFLSTPTIPNAGAGANGSQAIGLLRSLGINEAAGVSGASVLKVVTTNSTLTFQIVDHA